MSNSRQWVETMLAIKRIIAECLKIKALLKVEKDKKRRMKLLKRRNTLYCDILYNSETLESLRGHTAKWAINHWTRKLS